MIIKENTIILDNCLNILKSIEDNTIDCIITSPPYWRMRYYNTIPQVWNCNNNLNDKCNHNNVKSIREYFRMNTSDNSVFKRPWRDKASSFVEYGYCNKCGAFIGELGWEIHLIDYINHLMMILLQCKRILKPSGSLWINIDDRYAGSCPGNSNKNYKTSCPGLNPARDDIVRRKSLFGIPERLIVELLNIEMILRNKIIWQKSNAMAESASDRFTSSYEYLLFFVKNDKYFFNKQYELAFTSRDSSLINGVHMRNMRDIWNIQTDTSKKKHYATFPEKIAERVILASCPVDGIVLDPFAGTGTALKVAKRLGRKYIGIELSEKYYNIAVNRVKHTSEPLLIVN